MKFYLSLILLPLCVQVIIAQKTSVISEKKHSKMMTSVFEVGKLNGQPAKPKDPLIKDEFSVLKKHETTIRVKNKKDFPQILQPGQRIAIFLDDLKRRNHYVYISVGFDLSRQGQFSSLALLFNDKPIWQHKIQQNRLLISAVIPATYLEEDTNILQIRNQGLDSICFDWMRIDDIPPDTLMNLVAGEIQTIPYPEREIFPMGLVEADFRAVNGELKLSDSLKDFKAETGSRKSVDKRRKNLSELKEQLIKVLKENKEYNTPLSTLFKELVNTLKCGKDPVILIHGQPTENQVEMLSKIYANTIYYWVFQDKQENRKIIEIIRKNIPNAKIVAPSGFDNTGVLYPVYQPASVNAAVNKISWISNDLPEIWGKWVYRDPIRDFRERRMKERTIAFPIHINKWIWSGGDSIIMNNIADGSYFFDELSRKPLSPFLALKRTAKLFEGKPVKLISNLTPTVKDDFLGEVYWSALKNTDEIITIQIATKRESGKPVELVCPVPFSGEAECQIITGYIPKNDNSGSTLKKLETIEKTITIDPLSEKDTSGLFKYDFELTDCTTFRIKKKNAAMPAIPRDLLSSQKRTAQNSFQKGILKVVKQDIANTDIRKLARAPNGVLGGLPMNMVEFFKGKTKKMSSGGYSGQRDYRATVSTVSDVSNVVPWASKSTLVSVSFPNGKKPSKAEGVRLYFGYAPKEFREMSFWVYPTSKEPIKNATLQFYSISHRGKQKDFLAVNLKPEMWQRVIMPLDKIPCPHDICIVGDPFLPEYRKGNEVSFEFNGFAFVSTPDKSFSYRVITQKDSNQFKSMIILFLGKPGTIGNFRHRFEKPVKIKKAEFIPSQKKDGKLELLSYKDYFQKKNIVKIEKGKPPPTRPNGPQPKLIYHEEAQLFDTQFIFPTIENEEAKETKKPEIEISERILKLLTVQEKKKIEDGLIAIGLFIEFEE